MKTRTIFTLTLISVLSFFKIQSQNNDLMKVWANKGKASEENYTKTIPFRYVDGYMFVDVIQNGKKYNFIFDTGAEATIIDLSILKEFNHTVFGESEASGPLIEKQKMKTYLISKIELFNIDFIDIGAISLNLKPFEKKFCHRVYGIIGSNLIKKGVWQIDYKKQLITVSNTIGNLNLEVYQQVKTVPSKKGWGTESVIINFDGFLSKFQVDTGNGRNAIVSSPHYFSKQIKSKSVKKIQFGLKKADYSYKVKFDLMKIGKMEFVNQILDLTYEVGNNQLLGNRFFDNYILTLDLKNHFIYLKSNGEKNIKKNNYFDLKLVPNYKSNKIIVKTGVKSFLKKYKINKGDLVIKINKKEIENLKHDDFCNYMKTEFKELFLKDKTIELTIFSKNKERKVSINKSNKF